MSETSRFGDLHTKTYDIELLISGALVFGLATAPGVMDRLYDRWGARLDGVERNGRRPTIDSDVISGPLIRLYLPYRPRRHNPMIAKACPDLAAAVARGDAPDNAAGAACLGGLYRVALDGVGVTSTYRFTRDTDSDFVGVLAYLPAADLQPGPHELTIDTPGGNEDAAREVIKIPFYSVR